MNVVLLARGSGVGFSLYALSEDDTCPIQGFIDNLQNSHRKQVVALLNRITCHGIPTNEEKFRKLGDKIFELKTRSGVRILAFFGGSLLRKSLVLTHGFYKPHTKTLKREKEKAVKLHKEYLETLDNKKKPKGGG